MATTFTCFTELALELQEMVWEEAAADLPILDIQRFTAGITRTQGNVDCNSRPRHLLCFTPHADFIRLTTGHRGLLGCCRESRKAAQKHTSDRLLHINYLTTDVNGFPVPKQAFVPFNRAGHFCVSGLCLAIQVATGVGMARSDVAGSTMDRLQLQGLDESPVENLTVALEPPLDSGHAQDYMYGWSDQVFEGIASRMPNLKTVSLIGEGVLNRRHYIDQADFHRIHRSVAVNPKPRSRREQSVPWRMLWANWKREQILFLSITQSKISRMERRQSEDLDGRGSVNSAADAALKRELELTMSTAME